MGFEMGSDQNHHPNSADTTFALSSSRLQSVMHSGSCMWVTCDWHHFRGFFNPTKWFVCRKGCKISAIYYIGIVAVHLVFFWGLAAKMRHTHTHTHFKGLTFSQITLCKTNTSPLKIGLSKKESSLPTIFFHMTRDPHGRVPYLPEVPGVPCRTNGTAGFTQLIHT